MNYYLGTFDQKTQNYGGGGETLTAYAVDKQKYPSVHPFSR